MPSAMSPHKAVLQITIDVMEVKTTGECNGKPIKREELAQYGLKPVMTRTLNGFDKNDCLMKLKGLLDSMETK